MRVCAQSYRNLIFHVQLSLRGLPFSEGKQEEGGSWEKGLGGREECTEGKLWSGCTENKKIIKLNYK